MNWKKIFTIAALTGFSASVATGQGTAPTIIQGDYISNVFGNSNFIKNPNAKLNTKDVTVSNATVSRSISTPLVATSEFNVAITSADGTVTWATRAFDQGMKGQNCEARFTYRGFAATSKVHIKQGANTVATLNLTPATDPRIASINFPCGDLSTATTFQVTDTAILAGTNEIGGIYVGLATNQANVAQAEFIGSVRFGTNCLWQTTSSTYNSPTDSSCSTTVIGNVAADTVSVTKPSIIVNDTRPGNYYAVWSGGSFQKNQVATYQFCSIRLVDANIAIGSYVDPTNLPVIQAFSTSASFQYNTASTKTFQLQMKSSDNVTGCTLNTSTDETQISVYRFPTSSELVVTPERQNVFAAASWNGSMQANRTSTAETNVSDASFATNRTLFGKAQFTNTANDVAITVENMPPGTYRIELTAAKLGHYLDAATNDSGCTFYLKDGTNTAEAASIQYGVQYSKDNVSTATQIVKYTNTATRTFTASYAAVSATQQKCIVDKPKIIITPLDQPSNSALYVQGPVLASATGAAIPAGYLAEPKDAISSISCPANSVAAIGATATLTPGVWLVSVNATVINATSGDLFVYVSPQNNGGWREGDYNDGWVQGVSAYRLTTRSPNILVRYDGSTLYRYYNGSWVSAVTSTTGQLSAWVTKSTTTCDSVKSYISAIRLN